MFGGSKMKRVIPLIVVISATFSFFSRFDECKTITIAQSNGSLPTTINLNDNSGEEIRNYYSSLNSLEESERQGQNLLKNLKTILSNGQKMYSYDANNGREIWQMYEIIDRDWDLSPASSITYGTYDETTNTINNYQYGTGSSNSKNNPKIRALYVDRSVENPMDAWSNHNQTYGGINREHIWPKSHGFDEEYASNSDGARGDPMHLWAADGYTNNIHSNYFYGYVDTTKTYTDCHDKISYSVGNYRGTSKTLGSGTVFEPQDSDKGDIARAVFYMVARYNNIAGATSGIDANNPNLTLANNVKDNSVTGTSNASTPFSLGILQDLLEWNKLDPVDEFERHRNNLLFNNYTNNRNPFIDFPSWADYIWGTCENGVYDASIIGSANPSTDALGVNPISLSSDKSTLKVDETTKLHIVLDNDHADVEVTLSVNNSEVITLDKTIAHHGEEVTITSLKEGKAKITATANIDGKDVTNTINVTVKNQSVAPEEAGFKLDIKMMIIIGVVAFVLLVIVIIIFASANKKQRKKMVKAAKKVVKKSNSKSKSKKKK